MVDDDVTERYHGGEHFSREAHETTSEIVRKTQRAAVYRHIHACQTHGATCDETELALGMPHQTCSARFTELKAASAIFRISKRKTRQGKSAGVYVTASFRPQTIGPLFNRDDLR